MPLPAVLMAVAMASEEAAFISSEPSGVLAVATARVALGSLTRVVPVVVPIEVDVEIAALGALVLAVPVSGPMTNATARETESL